MSLSQTRNWPCLSCMTAPHVCQPHVCLSLKLLPINSRRPVLSSADAQRSAQPSQHMPLRTRSGAARFFREDGSFSIAEDVALEREFRRTRNIRPSRSG